jgi:cysteinyl-tRNA synthetase
LGTPGWHLECSVMASMMLGDNVYLHSGGIDLLYPHHHNEILQSTAYWNKTDVIKNFIHTGYLHIDGEKMSQSLKNFKTIHEVLQVMSANELRLLFMSTPWNGIMDLNVGSIENAKHANNRVINLRLELSRIFKNIGIDTAYIRKLKIISKELDNNFNNVGFMGNFNEYITGVNNILTKNTFDIYELIVMYGNLLAYEYIIGLDYTYLADVENNIRMLANMRNDMRKTKIEDISKLKDIYKFTDPKFLR